MGPQFISWHYMFPQVVRWSKPLNTVEFGHNNKVALVMSQVENDGWVGQEVVAYLIVRFNAIGAIIMVSKRNEEG